MVYRDIKPENIGFDIRGDVKIFDFGLCKSLEEKKKAKDYGYNITPRTGSIPYMAPEVAKGKPYDQLADVFSFSFLFWEIMALKWAFDKYTLQQYFIRVCNYNERPRIPSSWPIVIRTILPEAWNDEPKQRPNMKRIATLIRGCVQSMTNEPAVVNRTEHMLNKSNRSARGFRPDTATAAEAAKLDAKKRKSSTAATSEVREERNRTIHDEPMG